MAKSWVGHNNKVFQKLVGEHRTKLEIKLQKMCRELADEVRLFVEAFGEMDNMPYDTANLADGTGVGVYLNGQLMAYMPTQKATEPQEYNGNENIWGHEYLFDALFAAETDYPKGVWVVLFSTVPYAVRVDAEGTVKQRGKNKGETKTPAGYFSDRLTSEMLKNFKTAFAREFPNIARQIKSV